MTDSAPQTDHQVGIEQWIRRQVLAKRCEHSLIVSIISAVGAPFFLVLGPHPLNIMLFVYFTFMVANNLVYYRLQKRDMDNPSLIRSHVQFGMMQSVTWFFMITFMYRVGGDPALTLGFQVMGLAIHLILLEQIDVFSPLATLLSVCGSLVHIGAGILAWKLAHWDHIATAALILTTLHAWSWYQRLGVHRVVQKQAVSWQEARDLELQNDRLKIAAVERDLEFARELQQSAESLPDTLVVGRHLARVFHKAYETIGGDWTGVRQLDQDRTLFVVADVNGKGMPAAMVAQSLQTLWIKSSDDPSFDPVAWLHQVNRAMCRMGQREPYTLTIGMVLIGRDELTYISAGHVPLYIVHDLANPKSVQQVLAKGSPVGFGPSLDLAEVTVPMPSGDNYTIMFGSDGVINHQMRRNKRLVLDFAQALRDHGPQAIIDYPEADDKTLVWLRARHAA